VAPAVLLGGAAAGLRATAGAPVGGGLLLVAAAAAVVLCGALTAVAALAEGLLARTLLVQAQTHLALRQRDVMRRGHAEAVLGAGCEHEIEAGHGRVLKGAVLAVVDGVSTRLLPHLQVPNAVETRGAVEVNDRDVANPTTEKATESGSGEK
jgi:hypothetical protein